METITRPALLAFHAVGMASHNRRAMPTLLAAPDAFRGTAAAAAVAAAMTRAADSVGWSALDAPMSDGGEGFLQVYGAAVGARARPCRVTGPLGAPVLAHWARSGKEAVVEMAQASGLELVGGPEGNDPLSATTRGTGELIAAAAASGATRIVVGCGGSATTDGGAGALEALQPLERLRGVELVVACDVDVPFLEAAKRFAPQKGATPAEVELLSRRLEALANRYRSEFGVDVAEMAGAGAAGGLAGGLAALGATLVSGAELVADAIGLPEKAARCDLVVTGEGFFDKESLRGKVVGVVARIARAAGVPAVAVVGGSEPFEAPFPVVSMSELFGARRAVGEVLECVQEAVAGYLSSL